MELSLSHLSKSYGAVKALVDVDIVLHRGIYALLGPNGSGKSTLMHILTQNCKPDQGSVLWNGTNINVLGRAYRQHIGFLPQNAGLPEHFTCYECMLYLASLKGIPLEKAKKQTESLLTEVDLLDVMHRKVGGFSGGMKQRLLLAQALLGEPELVILDEPTAGLDPLQRIRVKQLIARYAETSCVLFATHIVSDIESLATHLLFLKQGRLVEFGKTAEVIKRTHRTLPDASMIENRYYDHFGERHHDDTSV